MQSVTPLTAEELMRWAEARGVPLAPERAAALVESVAGLFAFTRELDEAASQDVLPATVFHANE